MSPTVFSDSGLRFFFFSREEPRMHVHVMGQSCEAKFWLEPEIELSVNKGMSVALLKKAENLVIQRQEEIRNAWKRHFGG